MENYFDLLANDIKKLWGALDNLQRALIVILTIGAFSAIFFIIIKSMEPEWGVLYSDLSETDAVAIIENLKKGGYPFKLSDDKKTVLVPVEVKEDLRLMIAENEVIQDSNPGFELLNKIQFGATDFQNKLTRQKIFQDELTKTIEKIRGIKKARVQIAEPDRSVFSDKDEAPTASVMLILEPGIRIKEDQVKAIKNLVAYGIPRLTPDRVFVTDQNGISLADDLSKSSAGLTDYRTTFEQETAAKVQKVLQKIVGMGNVSVEVSAIINFDRAKTTIEQYTPAGTENNTPVGIVSTVSEEIEAYDKTKKEDLPSIEEESGEEGSETVATEESKGTNYQKTKTSKDYKVSKEIKQVVFAPGKVERMTIAVALNKILTSREKEEIKNLVLSASGADMERGDVITVSGIQFAADPNEENKPMLDQMAKVSAIQFVISQVGPLVVVLILGVTALLVLKSLLKKPLQGEEVYDSRHYIGSDDDSENDMIGVGPPIPAIEANLDPEVEKMRGEINSTIVADPSEAARLLLSYIKE
ncbi:MAG: flagellar M-ring protein FliF [Candidatus Melainabacteria bacterium GWF2_37_15]|nr:MAG: flagellar M-ring protein FliF [Candidatus Melainabacteria bacterium GWF2_37_15]